MSSVTSLSKNACLSTGIAEVPTLTSPLADRSAIDIHTVSTADFRRLFPPSIFITYSRRFTAVHQPRSFKSSSSHCILQILSAATSFKDVYVFVDTEPVRVALLEPDRSIIDVHMILTADFRKTPPPSTLITYSLSFTTVLQRRSYSYSDERTSSAPPSPATTSSPWIFDSEPYTRERE